MSRYTLAACSLAMFASAGITSSATASQTYLFPYFQSNGETGLYLSGSTDGIHFTALNDGNPIFTPPNSWTGQTLIRDASIIYHNGVFSMVWTTNWTGNVFGFAQSTNLKDWTNIRQIVPFSGTQPQNVWAPEIVWNPAANNYRVVFSSAMSAADYSADNLRMYSITSTDLITFTSTTSSSSFFDPGYSVIDGQMAYDSANARWIMVYKDERSRRKNLNFAYNTSADMTGTWTYDRTNPIIGPNSGESGYLAQAAEGPTLLNTGTNWFLYWDAFGNGHYGMASSINLTTWTDLTSQMTNPVSDPRHGTIFLAPSSAVAYVPEPTCLSLLVLAGTTLTRRQRS